MSPPRPRSITRRLMIAASAVAALRGSRAIRMQAAEPPGPAPGRPDGPIVDASLIQLIADPDRFDGKPVRVKGFLHVEFEGTALYLSGDDANHLITRNGLWISFGPDLARGTPRGMGPKQYNRKFVLIEGVFDKTLTGHKGLWSGGIREAWRVMEATKYYND